MIQNSRWECSLKSANLKIVIPKYTCTRRRYGRRFDLRSKLGSLTNRCFHDEGLLSSFLRPSVAVILPEISSRLFPVFGKAAGNFVARRKYLFRISKHLKLLLHVNSIRHYSGLRPSGPVSNKSAWVVWTISEPTVRIKSSTFVLFQKGLDRKGLPLLYT